MSYSKGDRAIRNPHTWRTILDLPWRVLPAVMVVGFIAVEVYRVTPAITISNLDYLASVERALTLSFSSLNRWVINEIHPVGYPWSIRLGLALGWDAARIGQALSIAGGVLALLGTYLLALGVFKDRRWAAIAQAFVAMTGLFLFYASYEGTDMLAAGFQILSIGLLAASTFRDTSPRPRVVFLAGLAVGLSYLIRYTGLITMGVGLLWLIAVAILAPMRSAGVGNRRSVDWQAIAAYLLGFFIGSALQWVASWLATGNPFYNDPGQNVWFHLYGKTDFIEEWQQAPKGISTLQVFAGDPVRFIQHWWSSFEQFWTAPELALLDAPLKLFAQAGLVFLILAPGPVALRQRGLVGLFILAHIASLSLLRLDRRFLLVTIPLLAIGAVYFFASLIPPRWEHPRSLSWNLLALLVGLIWAVQSPIGFVQGRSGPDKMVIEVSNILHAAGMSSPYQVGSTHVKLQDAVAIARDRFPQAYLLAPSLSSVDALVREMRTRGWRFFIYDRDTGQRVYPALESLLSPDSRPSGLAPIYFRDDRQFVIYRLAENPDGCSSLDAHFEGGISLQCYEVYISQDVPAGSGRRAGVYLHWQVQSSFPSSLKIFVHLLDAEGRVAAQSDSGPVLWTYPTDAWKPGEVVVDFHQFPIDVSVPAGRYTLQAGLYDEGTGARQSRLDTQGNPVDDKAVLSVIQIPK